MAATPIVGIVMGSDSDWPVLRAAAVTLKDFGVPYEARVLSAHRTPDEALDYAATAAGRGIKVLIGAAGGAAHLAGVLAAKTALPVLAVPMPSKHLQGLDSLLSMVQMPGGIPVATFAIGEAGATNAALFAIAMLALNDRHDGQDAARSALTLAAQDAGDGQPGPAEIERAAALLRAGELVAFPTETVYGLGADASNPQAVAKIFAAKGRPADHPLIVHLASAAALDRWARDIPEAARKLAAAFWPGPLTLILKRHRDVPDAVTGGQDTVGLRVPDHPLALALLRAFGGAEHASHINDAGIAAPSANRFGRISPTCAEDVRAELGERVALVLDGGPCAVGIESTIVDLTCGEPRVLRPGAIDHAALERVLGTPLTETTPAATTTSSTPRVSGSLAAHYAPRTPLRLVPATDLLGALHAEAQAGRRCAVLARTHAAPQDLPKTTLWLNAPHDAAGYAHDLYATLRRFDMADCAIILVEAPPATESWRAVADRLQRAACGSGETDST